MAAGKIGVLDEFESATEAVTNYVERVEMYFAANDVAEAKQVVAFLSAVGKKNLIVVCCITRFSFTREPERQNDIGVGCSVEKAM